MNDLSVRLFDFSVKVLKFTSTLPRQPEYTVIRFQLAKCSTSSGANYEEAQAGSSRADFKNKSRISLREMREANYWLRILGRMLYADDYKDILYLINESEQLKNILGLIVTKTNTRKST
jgi:four helix bundle protein